MKQMITSRINRSLLGYVLIFFAVFSGTGQSYVDVQASSKDAKFINYRIDPSDSEIDGSPYFKENWTSGVISFWKHTMEFDSMHFNIYRNFLLFRQDGKTLSIPPEVKVIGFTIGDSKFVSFDNNSEYKNVFFKVLSDGDKVMLLERFECKIIEGKASNGIVNREPDKYRMYSSYYVYKEGGEFQKVSGKLKYEVLFSDKEQEISSFIKKNKVKLKKEEDLIVLFKFIDELYK